MRSLLGLMILIAGCTGMVDDGRDVCALAARHLGSCAGQPAPTAEQCDGTAAAEANALLGLDCDSLAALGAPSGRAVTRAAPCSANDRRACEDYCAELFSALGLRLMRTTCELEEEIAHCQCKGSWWFW
jgi:hypothetical protein